MASMVKARIGSASLAVSLGALAAFFPRETRGSADTGATQQEIIARLTAEGARSTPAEREATVVTLTAAIEALGLRPQRHDYRLPNKNGLLDLLLAPYRGTNVYTVVEATHASPEYVVVGAHFDSERGSPGAVDNASGVALVHELALRLARMDERHVNVLLVFFDQEEDGSIGSRAFARHLEGEGYRIHSVHVVDMVGWDADGDRTVEVQSPGPVLEPYYRRAAARLGIPLHLTQGSASDTGPFRRAGHTTVGVWEDITHGDSTPYHHDPEDTYETVDFGYLDRATALVFGVLEELAGEERDGS